MALGPAGVGHAQRPVPSHRRAQDGPRPTPYFGWRCSKYPGAAAAPPPSALGPGGPSVPGLLPARGSPGVRRRCGAVSAPAVGPAWHSGPFREVEEGEVSQQHGQAGTSIACPLPPPRSPSGILAGFGVPISDAPPVIGRGEKGPCSYFGVFSPARIPPTGGAAIALCRSWVIFRAPAYILALSQSGWVAPPGTGGRGPP